MNIIFLDFDGVINNNQEIITPEALKNLKKIIALSQAKIVVISSWFMHSPKRREKISEFLTKLKITNFDLIKVDLEGTYNGEYLSYRSLGIIDYIFKHPNIYYIVLDDEFKKEYNLLNIYCLTTNSNTGLVKEDILKITFKQPNLTTFEKIKYLTNSKSTLIK